ncbi:hypothetical protein ACFVZD_42595 [Streptomyces sp. NPDC058287]|uniref:hypothetical protein n=1 Tax=unclassified Streptomyces TaxID=2593676 RepID=UPI0036E26BC3
MEARGFLQIAPGRRVTLNGVEWKIDEVHGQLGRLVLVDDDGRTETRSFRWLINHADLRLLPSIEAARQSSPASRQPRTLADLTEDQLERARLRAAHLLETETGFREGHPARALPGEPRPAYDPERTTLTQRRYAKAAETEAMRRPEAVRLGLQHLSYRTLVRSVGSVGRQPPAGLRGRALDTATQWAPQYHRGGPRGDLRGQGRVRRTRPRESGRQASVDAPVHE